MKISVLIPAYNCQGTIRHALDSVLAQTRPPDEVLVMNDGSTDQTSAILESYKPRVQVLKQENQGVSAARNRLLELAQGDLLVWLDSDDVWHPRCLDVQSRSFTDHPEVGALFVGHIDFRGVGPYVWHFDPLAVEGTSIVLDPLKFFRTLVSDSGNFMGAFCCITRQSARRIGGLVAPPCISVGEDFFMSSMIALKGLSAVYAPYPLVAYRVRDDSLSRMPVPTRRGVVQAFELLEPHFRASAPCNLLNVFEKGFASARRGYAKALMGEGRKLEARREIFSSFGESHRPDSLLKSAGLLAATFLPKGSTAQAFARTARKLSGAAG
jgi:glycosyltransferase involved in cell wall biosynthesis